MIHFLKANIFWVGVVMVMSRLHWVHLQVMHHSLCKDLCLSVPEESSQSHRKPSAANEKHFFCIFLCTESLSWRNPLLSSERSPPQGRCLLLTQGANAQGESAPPGTTSASHPGCYPMCRFLLCLQPGGVWVGVRFIIMSSSPPSLIGGTWWGYMEIWTFVPEGCLSWNKSDR